MARVSEGWSDYEIAQAIAELATYSDIADLNFSITTDQSTATF
jgi:hypothetical protein